MMNTVIAKRTAIMNFFKNEDKEYSKEEILNKEFAVLSFSPHEEYIDVLVSPYDDLCVDLSTFEFENSNEVYMKGIITDIDRKKGYIIFHIQNKDALASITCSGAVLEKYDKHIIVGEPVITKCSIYNGRPSLGFLINLNKMDMFEKECNYISGKSFDKVNEIMSDKEKNLKHYGVIVQCRLSKNKNNRDMVIGTLYDGKKIRGFATVKTYYNKNIPREAVAGDFVSFNRPTNEFVLNNVQVVSL